MKSKLISFALALVIAMLLCACTSVRTDVQEESSTASSAEVYYVNGNYSHLMEDIKSGGTFTPSGLFWLDEDLLRETFGPEGPVNVYLPENWEDGSIKFNFSVDLYGEYTGLAEAYELTEDQLLSGYMTEWPWDHWGNLTPT